VDDTPHHALRRRTEDMNPSAHTKRPLPKIDLPLQRIAGFVPDTGDALAEWVTAFLRDSAQSDVCDKLAASGAAERHAFVFVIGFAPVPFAVTDLLIRSDAASPSVNPDLPEAVADVWIVSSWSTGTGFRWSNGTGWLRFDKRSLTGLIFVSRERGGYRKTKARFPLEPVPRCERHCAFIVDRDHD
jgi:hypothetical protein